MTHQVSVLLRSAFVTVLIGSCASGHDVATDGRRAVIGLDADSFQTCAGIPTRHQAPRPTDRDLFLRDSRTRMSAAWNSVFRWSAAASRSRAVAPTATRSSASSTARSPRSTTPATTTTSSARRASARRSCAVAFAPMAATRGQDGEQEAVKKGLSRASRSADNAGAAVQGGRERVPCVDPFPIDRGRITMATYCVLGSFTDTGCPQRQGTCPNVSRPSGRWRRNAA